MALLRLTPFASSVPVVLASCGALVAVAPLGAATAEAKRSFDLPRGDAAVTLRQFAAASGRSLVFVTDKVRGETTNAVRGEFTPREALERMLAGSALEAAQDAATGALVVSRKPAPAPRVTGEVGPVSDPQPKSNTHVTKPNRSLLAILAAWLALGTGGQAQTAPNPKPGAEEALVLTPFEVRQDRDIGYLATNSTSATRFNVQSRDLSLSLQSITSELLRDQAHVDLNEALSAIVPGLQPGNIPRQSIIRGMASDYPLRNGVPTFGVQDLAHIDRIEILKGPGATLYGVTQPGGVRNMLPKLPTFRPQFAVSQRIDSDDRLRTEVEARGPIFTEGRFGKLAYRVVGVYDEYQKYADWQVRHDRLIYPALLWQPRAGTQLLYEYDYKDYDQAGTTGFLQIRRPGEAFNRFATAANWGRDLPYAFNVSGPSPKNDQRMRVSNLVIDQKLGETWAARGTYSWQPYDSFTQQYAQNGIPAPGATAFTNLATVALQRFRQEFARLDFLGVVQRPSFTNRTLIGADYLWRTNRNWQWRDATRNAAGAWVQRAIPLDVNAYSTPTFANNWLYDFTDFQRRQPLLSLNTIWDATAGAYVVNQFSYRERTFLLGGLRYDRIKTTTKGSAANFLPINTYAAPVGTRVSPQIGVSHRVLPSVSAYANLSSSVFGNSQVNPDGTGFEPQFATGWDAGFKIETPGNKLSASLAAFQTENKNLPVADPAAANDPARRGYFVLLGKTRAEGFDTTFTFTPRPAWQITGGYTYVDAYNALTGEALVGNAKSSFNLWSRYSFNQGALKGVALGGGARWRGELYRGVVQERYRDELAICDAFATYQARFLGRRWSLQLNVRNIFNRRQVSDFNHPFGDGRTYILTARYEQ